MKIKKKIEFVKPLKIEKIVISDKYAGLSESQLTKIKSDEKNG